MFQLRGLGLWPFSSDEPQAPSADTVRSWWGSVTSPATSTQTYQNAILATNLIQAQSIAPTPPVPSVNTPTPPNPLFQPVTPGTTVVTSGSTPWWQSWWLLGLLAAGGVGLWLYSRPKAAASTAIAGLFKRRR